jgi:hypothetical protein
MLINNKIEFYAKKTPEKHEGPRTLSDKFLAKQTIG